MTGAEFAGLTSRELEMPFEQLLLSIGVILSHLASSHDGHDGQDEDESEIEEIKLSEDNEPSCVMGTITQTVHQCMERFRLK
jgi:hypothetical protein